MAQQNAKCHVRATSRPNNPDSRSFLDLPAEIRNRIYEIVYEHRDPLIVTHAESRKGLPILHQLHSDNNARLMHLTTDTDTQYIAPGQSSSCNYFELALLKFLSNNGGWTKSRDVNSYNITYERYSPSVPTGAVVVQGLPSDE